MGAFDDLLSKNRAYQDSFRLAGFDGIARAGVAMVTCMDSRIEPLEMIGLEAGDAKIIRTPGGRVTPDAFVGCVLAAHLLGVERILVVAHTKCAMASGEDLDIVKRVRDTDGYDLSELHIGASPDQLARLTEDVELLRSSAFIQDNVDIGGFVYNVDSGSLDQKI